MEALAKAIVPRAERLLDGEMVGANRAYSTTIAVERVQNTSRIEQTGGSGMGRCRRGGNYTKAVSGSFPSTVRFTLKHCFEELSDGAAVGRPGLYSCTHMISLSRAYALLVYVY